MKFNYFYKRSLKPGVGNLIINKVEVLISSSVWTWMFTRIQTCPRLRIRARAITKISREWHQSKNDKVIVEEYFVEQWLSSYVHCYAHVRMVIIGRQFSLHSTRVYERYEISHLKVDQKYVFDIKFLLQKLFSKIGAFLTRKLYWTVQWKISTTVYSCKSTVHIALHWK